MSTFQYLIILGLMLAIALGQKVAPGVPPQHYMDPNQNLNYQQVPQMQYVQPGQQVHPQQMHPQQVHPQQVHPQQIHQQQVHPQQVHPQQVHPQQVPVQHDPNAIHQQQQQMAAGQPVHRPQQQILDTANIQGEKAHIQEHFDVPMDTSKMSEQELQFHYFKMHDSDHNNKLDGCELIKSLIHWHEKGNKDSHHKEEGAEEHHDKIFSDEELVSLIDPILAMDDTGRDGYIDYPEFIKAQQKAAAQRKVEKP